MMVVIELLPLSLPGVFDLAPELEPSPPSSAGVPCHDLLSLRLENPLDRLEDVGRCLLSEHDNKFFNSPGFPAEIELGSKAQ